jgi:beta-xylosidase
VSSEPRRLRRFARAALALVALAGAAAACTPTSTLPASPPPPFKDAANGAPSDHGWFEGGKLWSGDFGDPHVMRVGSTYYAYASPVGGRYLPVLTSMDLTNWTIHRRWSAAGPPGAPGYNVNTDPAIPAEIRASALSDWGKYDNNDALARTASWGLNHPQGPWISKDLWAPGVFNIGSTWYAYSAVRTSWTSDDPHGFGRFCLTVASSSSPLGPFRDISGGTPIQCQPVSADPAGSIDPYPYRDPATGRNYLLWKAAGKVGDHESALMSVELGSNGKPLPGAPWVKLLQTNRAAPWEGGTIENPAMITYNGTTYLFYSANYSGVLDSAGRSTYATGYAICPQGPRAACTRPRPGSPLLASNGNDQGPGGASAFTDTSNRLKLAYATFWLGENRNGYHPRRLHTLTLVQNADKTLRIG